MPTQPQVAKYLNISERTFRRYSTDRRARLTKDCAHNVNQEIADLIGHLNREVYKHNVITGLYAFTCLYTGAFSLNINDKELFSITPLTPRNLALAIKKLREVTYG